MENPIAKLGDIDWDSGNVRAIVLFINEDEGMMFDVWGINDCEYNTIGCGFSDPEEYTERY
jgi:hypothetical protein